MTKDDFNTLMATVREMRESVERHSSNIKASPRNLDHYRHGMHDFVNEAQHFASMVSQVLDNEELPSVQRIALKGSLLQLELELRLLQSQLYGP